jgi:eukaryotic-like serine/threonine-protein kinase
MGSMSFGKYKLIAELGHGGMADVFLAVQAGPAGSGFRKLTVIKRLRQNLADEPEFVAMLVDEARIAARLNHPNVVQTNEVGNVGNHYFIAMEYLDGQPLHRIQHRSMQRVKTNPGPPILSAEQQYLILMDTLAGLHHAHELTDYDGSPLDIVHRDVTPQNVFVTYEGQVKVVDFGIAKAAGRASETRQGVVKGKVRYMAPEQAIGLNVTRRSDVFAVGIMLWEAAVGRRMWKDKDDLQIVQSLVSGDLPLMPRDADPPIPEGIEKICRKALSMRPEDRHATADELRLDIEQFLAESGKLVTARRQIAPMVGELFKDKRAEIRSIIEKQLASVEDGAPSTDITVVPTDSTSNPSLSVSVRTQPVGLPEPPAASVATQTNANATVQAPRSNSMRPVIFVALAALVAVAAISIWKTSVSKAGASTTEAKKVEDVSVRLSANPTTARVSLDDNPLQPLPLDIRVSRDDRLHHVRVEAEGYETRSQTLSFARDVVMTFELTRRGSDPTTATSETKRPAPVHTPPNPPPWRPTVTPKAPETAKPEAKPEPTTAPLPPPPHTAPESSSNKARNLSLDKGDPWGQKSP